MAVPLNRKESMKNSAIPTAILAMALLLPLAACSQTDKADSNSADNAAQAIKEVQDQTSPSMISAEIHKGIEQAKQELATKDIDLNDDHVGHRHHDDHDEPRNLPKAAITPQGDLVIAGKTVPASPEQHAM